MFEGLVEVGKGIRTDLIEVYWILLVPLVCFLIAMELFKDGDEPPQGGRILKRVVTSVLLLISFNLVVNTIGALGDGIIDSLKLPGLREALTELGPTEATKSNEWFNLREHIIYVFSLIAYLFAFLGFYVAEAMTHFVWVVLYPVSPLMILAYVPPQTANVTGNLYKGLIKVIVWKILWSILGALLIAVSKAPVYGGTDEWMMAVVMNLCIGLAMLFIPMASKSLINDGLEGLASGMSAAPAIAGLGAAKHFAHKAAGKTLGASKQLLSYGSRPIRNVAERGSSFAKQQTGLRENIERPMNTLNRKYSELGMNEDQKNERRSKVYKKLRGEKTKGRKKRVKNKQNYQRGGNYVRR